MLAICSPKFWKIRQKQALFIIRILTQTKNNKRYSSCETGYFGAYSKVLLEGRQSMLTVLCFSQGKKG